MKIILNKKPIVKYVASLIREDGKKIYLSDSNNFPQIYSKGAVKYCWSYEKKYSFLFNNEWDLNQFLIDHHVGNYDNLKLELYED